MCSVSECRVGKFDRPFVASAVLLVWAICAVLLVSAISDGVLVERPAGEVSAPGSVQNTSIVKAVPDFHPAELQSGRTSETAVHARF